MIKCNKFHKFACSNDAAKLYISGRGSGKMVSVLPFYSDSPSSIPESAVLIL